MVILYISNFPISPNKSLTDITRQLLLVRAWSCQKNKNKEVTAKPYNTKK